MVLFWEIYAFIGTSVFSVAWLGADSVLPQNAQQRRQHVMRRITLTAVCGLLWFIPLAFVMLRPAIHRAVRVAEFIAGPCTQ